jgi:hypothetical protein
VSIVLGYKTALSFIIKLYFTILGKLYSWRFTATNMTSAEPSPEDFPGNEVKNTKQLLFELK